MLDILSGPVALTDFLGTSLRLSVPLAFAALGGVLSERSGVYNIGLEGMILVGAFGAALGTWVVGTPAAGLFTGVLFGALLSLMLAVLAVSLGVNQIVSGIAINIFTLGLTSFLARVAIGPQANTTVLPGFKAFAIPWLASIPVLGPVLFEQNLLVYLMYLAVPALFFVLYYTPWGLNIRAAGHNPRACDAAGIRVNRVRYLCLLTSGVLAALGGCYLVLTQVFVFSEHMSAGKGFIALAAVILGRWNPVGALLACLLFGSFDALQLRLQFANPDVPYQIFVILPYVVSILALVAAVGRTSSPQAIGIPYRREGR